MSISTIRQLSLHQIEQLRAYFAISEVQTVGVVIETGEVIIEYIAHYQGSLGLNTKKIPLINPAPIEIAKIV